jgi:patatin-related protein
MEPEPKLPRSECAQQVPDQTEHRIAIAFSGGVALAVYESGVAIELLRLVRREKTYQQLHDTLGDIVVDIITGTSAGGLNGALLAVALANQTTLRGLSQLWIEQGDIGRLLYTSRKRDPVSFLNGEWFYGKIRQTLNEMVAEKSSEEPYPYLDLFITATNLDGDQFYIEVEKGHSVPVRTYRQVLHFRYRKGDSLEPSRNDFLSDKDLDRVALAARTTASFPVAFAPVMLKKADFVPADGGKIAGYLHSDACHIDGGVLDNRPIDLAVEAIARRRATKRVKRFLFFVEPDPEEPEVNADDKDCRRSPLQVAIKALLTLPTYQSLTSSFEALQDHNRSVKERRAVLDFYDRVLGANRKGAKSIEQDSLATGSETVRQTSATDRASLWYRAFEDAYLDLRLRRYALVREDGTKISTSAAEMFQELDRRAPEETNGVAELSYRAKRLLLDQGDLRFYRRLYRYLAELVRSLTEKPSFGGTVLAHLNELKAKFYEDEARIAQREQAQEAGARLEAITAIEQYLAAIVARTEAHPTEEDLEKLLEFLKECAFLKDNWEFLESVRSEAFHTLKKTFLDILKELEPHSPVAAQLTTGYWKIRDSLDAFFLRDMFLFPLMTDTEFAMELERVSFWRISPADARTAVSDAAQHIRVPGELPPRDKLAGEVLAHFGGFLKSEWRSNDIVWGRLDASEILIRRLTQEGVEAGRLSKDTVDRWVTARKIEILNEIYPQMTIYDPPESTSLIGRQTLSAVPAGDKFGWASRVVAIANRMLGQVRTDSEFSSLLTKPLKAARASLRGASIALWLTSLMYRASTRRILLVLLVIALVIVGTMLWSHSIKELLHELGRALMTIGERAG